MLTTKLRSLLEEYHRKKWFPLKYPDVYGEFIDYVSDGMIQDLQEKFKEKRNPALIHIAHYIYQVLSSIQFHDLHVNNLKAYSDALMDGKVMPAFLFYYLRSLPREQSLNLWQEFQTWSLKWQTPMEDWLDAEFKVQRSFAALEETHFQILGLEKSKEIDELEINLRTSREFFDWMLKKKTPASNLPDLFQYFRLHECDELADWDDFPGLGKNILNTCRIRKSPHLRKCETEDALQFLFPIDPPRRLVLEFGKAAGAWDAARFTFELGKGAFFAGMNPALSVEQRIIGDPALPIFWGHLYSNLLASRYGLNRLINPPAESLAEDLSLCFQFWIRYDASLAIYRARLGTDLKISKDLYVSCFETAFTIRPPYFLYLYDLERSAESLFRVVGYRGALAAEERLRSLYGTQWFTSEKCAGRIREYWRHGFQYTLQEILDDLDASPDPDFFLNVKS
jgi:hypothetical protein